MSDQEFGVVAGGFVIVPHELLDEAPDGSVVLVYISLYRHGHGSREGCWCSQQRLSQESGVYLKGVRKALLWLEEAGWVQGDHRAGRTAIYRVITQRHLGRNEPRSKTTQVENDLGVRSKTTQVPRSKTTYEQKPSNKNPITKTQEPPTPRKRGKPPAAACGRKQAQKLKQIQADQIPTDLADCAQLICDWMDGRKTGLTEAAFKRNLDFLRRYTPAQRQQILDASIRSGWQGLFEPRETKATGNGSQLIGGSRQSHNAAMVIADCQARRQQQAPALDPISAALQAQERRIAAARAVTVEVLT